MTRGEIITALTQCLRGNDASHCDGCPYNSNDFRCRLDLRDDAIELLKAQEPIEERLNLCESCKQDFGSCAAQFDDIVFGNGTGNDNVIGCGAYVNRWKTQEPRVLTLKEVDALEDSALVYIECAYPVDGQRKTVIKPAIYQANNSSPEEDGYYCIVSAWAQSGFYSVDGYGIDWRCWTSRPTDAQREAVKWE